MPRIRLLHWNASESLPVQNLLKTACHHVEYDEADTSALMREWRQNPPDLFVIDLSRMPSRGMEIAIALRQSPRTKYVPIVFCEGLPEKVARIREGLPDASYCTLTTLIETVKAAHAPVDPVKPADMMNRYATRSTAQKLGVKEGSKIAVLNTPRNLISVLGELPRGVELCERTGDVTLCFVHSVDQLRADLSRVRSLADKTKLWIVWCKKTSRAHAGVTDELVRATGLAMGLVDYKVCSLDKDWTGMLFACSK